MAKNDVQVNFRMPAALRERLTKSAEANNRSITSEVVERLELSFNMTESYGVMKRNIASFQQVTEALTHFEKSIEQRDRLIEALGGQLATLAKLSQERHPESAEVLGEVEAIGSAFKSLDFSTGASLFNSFNKRYAGPPEQRNEGIERPPKKSK